MDSMLLFAAVTGCAAILSLAAGAALQRAFREYRARYVTRSLSDLAGMFLFLDAQQLLVLAAAATALLAGLGTALGGPLLGALGAGAGLCAPGGAVRFVRRARLQRFDRQLAGALQQLANALRAGLTLQQSIEQVGREAAAPLGQELSLFSKEVKLGTPVEAALHGLAARVPSEDLQLVVTSAILAKQLGGNLAEMLETVAATVRERFRLEGRIRALTSQGKLQGLIVSLLPIGVGVFFAAVRPDLMAPMFDGAFGWVLLSAIALLELIGFLLIRRIVSIDL